MNTEHGAPGATKIVAGLTRISNGEKWLPYPGAAHELISEAQSVGWGFDDGLPDIHLDENGTPFVRILIGREPGENAEDPEAKSPGFQFHISWSAPEKGSDPRKSWHLRKIYVKTSESDGWDVVSGLREVRAMMASHPVQLPNRYPVSV